MIYLIAKLSIMARRDQEGLNRIDWRYRTTRVRSQREVRLQSDDVVANCVDPQSSFEQAFGNFDLKQGCFIVQFISLILKFQLNKYWTTRATQNSVYRPRRAGVKGSLFSFFRQAAEVDANGADRRSNWLSR